MSVSLTAMDFLGTSITFVAPLLGQCLTHNRYSVNVSCSGVFFLSIDTIFHIHFLDKFPNELGRDPMANETYLSQIPFIKGSNLGHISSMN